MEAPRFVKNKTVAFSSAFLALGIAACGGKVIVDAGTVIPETTKPVSLEQKPLTVNSNIINIDNSPLLANLTLDNSCGIVLKPGDKATVSMPLDNNPNSFTVDFDLSLIKDPTGKLFFASIPVENGHSIALVDAANKIIPLGNSLPIGQDQILFAFFKDRKFKVLNCAVDNPKLH
jgi:hypothetical protein